MSLKSDYTPTLNSNTIVYLKDLKVWFSLRKGFKELITVAPPRYVKAVDGVSFAINEGEVFALVGESGCGKTTTGRAIIRLIDPTYGVIGFKPSEQTLKEVLTREGDQVVLDTKVHVNVAMVKPKNMKPLRREMQIVFQDPYASLNPRQTILSILSEPLEIHEVGDTREERIEMVAKALEMVKLTPPEDFMYRYPHQLSGGQRQRVVIARAIILKPRFVVADEPVSMLDVSIRAEILKLLMELKEQLNLSYLFITHELALTRYITNRIAVMYLGKIVELGSTEKILSNSLHPYTRALIKAIPEPEPDKRKDIKILDIKGEVPSAVDIPSGCRFHPRCPMLDKNPDLGSRCKFVEPPLTEIEREHYVACWLYTKT
ncbi:MAG: ABC transporter ATP-binding protein [Ignisphaera sp.]|uniref:ABC transporter ATP-binding protein n=1 Tax=Ignisphaera aggregans TaxID=334771 RepID=A0A7C4NQ02_9CREN